MLQTLSMIDFCPNEPLQPTLFELTADNAKIVWHSPSSRSDTKEATPAWASACFALSQDTELGSPVVSEQTQRILYPQRGHP